MTGVHAETSPVSVATRSGFGSHAQGRTSKVRLLFLMALSGLLFMMAATGPAFANKKYAAIVMDVKNNQVVFSRNADARRYPASLTKMMTLYMLFDALDSGKLTLASQLQVSPHAASQQPSKLGLKPGTHIRVRDAILALAVKSANDVAVVVAEALGGTESQFAVKATKKARAIGMSRTTFRNASGLPNRRQVTTARDMLTLSLALQRDFPQFYGFFSTPTFTWKGRTFKSHNKLLGKFRQTDGIKTGYIRASGFNLAASTRHNGQHLVAVVLGGKTARSRNQHMMDILAKGFVTADRNTRIAMKATPPVPNLKPGSGQPTVVASAALPVTPAPASRPTHQTGTQTASLGGPQGSIGDLVERAGRSLESMPNEPNRWGIQIGAYVQKESAEHRVQEARQMAPDLLGERVAAVVPVESANKTFYRARFGPFDEGDADRACSKLQRFGFLCFKIPQTAWEQLKAYN